MNITRNLRQLGRLFKQKQSRLLLYRYTTNSPKCDRINFSSQYLFSSSKEDPPKDFYENKVKDTAAGKGYSSIQLKTGCLSLYSYVIISDGQAAIIDPLNEIDQYRKVLSQNNVKLKYILMTHFHADFVSGQTDLARLYPDVKIFMGTNATSSAYKVHVLNDKDSIKVGNITIEAIHTPGHTLESTCFLLKDQNNKPQSVYTGDTIFIGEVGRPDLAANSGMNSEGMAKLMYASIQKIKALPDDLTIYPGHGAGSACGKSIGKGDKTLVGSQKSNNYAFKATSEAQFTSKILKDMSSPPQYFFNSVATNKQNPFDFEQTLHKVFKALSPESFQEEMKNQNTIILDVRSNNNEFYDGVIKGAFFVGHEGPLATYAGTLFKPTNNFLIFAGTQQQAQHAIKRLLRIGYLNIKGYNDFDLDQWTGEIVKYNEATTQDIQEVGDQKSSYSILDIRNKPELQREGRYSGAHTHIPIPKLQQAIQTGILAREKKYLVHCASGYRSKIAATYLSQHGYDFKVLSDSYKSYKQKGAKVVPLG